MKTITLKLAMIALFFCSFTAEAKRIQINESVTSSDGRVWQITGWIDVSAVFGWPPIKVNGYDITMTGSNGQSYHFQGRVFAPSGGNPRGISGPLVDLSTNREVDYIVSFLEIIDYFERTYPSNP